MNDSLQRLGDQLSEKERQNLRGARLFLDGVLLDGFNPDSHLRSIAADLLNHVEATTDPVEFEELAHECYMLEGTSYGKAFALYNKVNRILRWSV